MSSWKPKPLPGRSVPSDPRRCRLLKDLAASTTAPRSLGRRPQGPRRRRRGERHKASTFEHQPPRRLGVEPHALEVVHRRLEHTRRGLVETFEPARVDDALGVLAVLLAVPDRIPPVPRGPVVVPARTPSTQKPIRSDSRAHAPQSCPPPHILPQARRPRQGRREHLVNAPHAALRYCPPGRKMPSPRTQGANARAGAAAFECSQAGASGGLALHRRLRRGDAGCSSSSPASSRRSASSSPSGASTSSATRPASRRPRGPDRQPRRRRRLGDRPGRAAARARPRRPRRAPASASS